jgi:ParB family chromosome partitioning protein
MARKDLLKGLLGDPPAPPADTAPPRQMRGAIGAVSQSINDLRSRAMIDVAADLIDDAGLADRLDDDADGIAALADSIAAHGQQVPVLLRHAPDHEGRFQVVYGRRRVAALRRLGLPVRAMVRDLNDHDLVVAQGQENAARKDLSFIEKAVFAQAMVDRGFARKVVEDALHIDKTVVSRMLSVTAVLPLPVIRAIGAAPAAGRDRWLALAARVRGHEDAAVAAAQGATSDDRFAAVMAALSATRARPAVAVLAAADGTPLGEMRRARGRVTLALSGDGAAFGGWLADNITALHRDWLASRDGAEAGNTREHGRTE